MDVYSQHFVGLYHDVIIKKISLFYSNTPGIHFLFTKKGLCLDNEIIYHFFVFLIFIAEF